MQQERAAADAAGLRLHQRQHHLHGDRGVDRRAAGLEHLVAGVGGQRVGRRDRELASRPAGLVGVARRALGLDRPCTESGPLAQLAAARAALAAGDGWRQGERQQCAHVRASAA